MKKDFANASYPVTLKEFLRIVVGSSIPSARTETDRMKFFRRFVTWWNDGTKEVNSDYGWPPPPKVEDTISQVRAKGFSEQKLSMYCMMWDKWNADRLKRRGKAGAAKRWEKSNPPIDSDENPQK